MTPLADVRVDGHFGPNGQRRRRDAKQHVLATFLAELLRVGQDASVIAKRALVALAVAVGCASVATVLVIPKHDDQTLRPPQVTVVRDGGRYQVQWTNPSRGVDYEPLAFNVIVYTRKGLIQDSFIYGVSESEDGVPDCCSARILAGERAVSTLPRMRYPVGSIEFVSLRLGEHAHQDSFPSVLCTLGATGPSSCRQEAT